MKAKLIFIAAATLLATTSLHAQGHESLVMAEIEANNTSLKAWRDDAQAQKLGNKTGIHLPNPEVEVNYLWGSPGVIGNRTDLNARQEFDFQTIAGMKRRLANQQNGLVDWQYQTERINLLLEAKLYCIDLIYYNKLRQQLLLRREHAQAIANGYRGRLKQGDVNKLEYNKLQLNLAMVQGELSEVEVERRTLLGELQRLNGGLGVTLDDVQYAEAVLPASFNDWFLQVEQKSPVLERGLQEVEISKKQLSMSKALGFPRLWAGYLSEKVVGQHYQGLRIGLSIPLWENKNRVKQARAAVKAAESQQLDRKQQYHAQLRSRYDRASGLNAASLNYRESLASLNSTALLKKALEAGEVSLLDYIVEISLYYNTVNQALKAEREYQKAFAALWAVER